MTSPSLTSGTMVSNAVRLTSPLGAGGMGTVWLAHHLSLETDVVVKTMSPELVSNAANVARFSREAAAAAQVRSPHVVQMLDHGLTADGIPYIVMERLEGHDLFSHIEAEAPMRPGEVASIVVQTARALQRAHDLGIVHRDIKPENIFLCNVGSGELFLKVLDFGIAKSSIGKTPTITVQQGMVFGTPFYMSPESLVSGEALDRQQAQQGDLWALAVVAFEALTNRRPFEGDTISKLTLELHEPRRPRPSALVPFVPRALDEWFLRAFDLDPRRRFQSAKEMADAFVAAQPVEPIRASIRPPLSAGPAAPARGDTRPIEGARLAVESAVVTADRLQRAQLETAAPPPAVGPTVESLALPAPPIDLTRALAGRPTPPGQTEVAVTLPSAERLAGSEQPAARRSHAWFGLAALAVIAISVGVSVALSRGAGQSDAARAPMKEVSVPPATSASGLGHVGSTSVPMAISSVDPVSSASSVAPVVPRPTTKPTALPTPPAPPTKPVVAPKASGPFKDFDDVH